VGGFVRRWCDANKNSRFRPRERSNLGRLFFPIGLDFANVFLVKKIEELDLRKGALRDAAAGCSG
jgi:hypothetical protein